MKDESILVDNLIINRDDGLQHYVGCFDSIEELTAYLTGIMVASQNIVDQCVPEVAEVMVDVATGIEYDKETRIKQIRHIQLELLADLLPSKEEDKRDEPLAVFDKVEFKDGEMIPKKSKE